jgi:hypothetical protein
MSCEANRAESNLLLLCVPHHADVDDRRNTFTVDILREWKVEQQSLARERGRSWAISDQQAREIIWNSFGSGVVLGVATGSSSLGVMAGSSQAALDAAARSRRVRRRWMVAGIVTLAAVLGFLFGRERCSNPIAQSGPVQCAAGLPVASPPLTASATRAGQADGDSFIAWVESSGRIALVVYHQGIAVDMGSFVVDQHGPMVVVHLVAIGGEGVLYGTASSQAAKVQFTAVDGFQSVEDSTVPAVDAPFRFFAFTVTAHHGAEFRDGHLGGTVTLLDERDAELERVPVIVSDSISRMKCGA